jgi:hypothetical protein
MGTHKKVIEQIKVDLLSDNEQLVKKALTKTRDKGNEQLINPLFELFGSTKKAEIKEEVKAIFAEIKNKNSIDFILPHLQNNSNEIKELALYGLWSSGLDMTDHIPAVIESACNGNFMVILEALTVLENLEGPFPEEDLIEANTLIQERLYEAPDSPEKNLLQSMYEVVQGYENKID